MQLTIDTNNLSEMDIRVLQLLTGTEAPVAKAEPKISNTPAPAATPTPAKKAAPAKAAAPAAPAPEPEPEAPAAEPDEDLLGGQPTLADAVTAATALVASGGAAKVRSALEVVGAKKVSEVQESDIPAFLAALEA